MLTVENDEIFRRLGTDMTQDGIIPFINEPPLGVLKRTGGFDFLNGGRKYVTETIDQRLR